MQTVVSTEEITHMRSRDTCVFLTDWRLQLGHGRREAVPLEADHVRVSTAC